MKTIVAIRRAERFSPNSADKDTAILQAVCERLAQKGLDVKVEEEETTVYVDSPKEETVVQAEKKNAHIKEEKAQPRKEKVQAKRQVKDTAINKGWWKSNLVFVTIACAVVGVSLFIYKGCYSTDAPMGHIGSEQADTVYVDTVAVDTTYIRCISSEPSKPFSVCIVLLFS